MDGGCSIDACASFRCISNLVAERGLWGAFHSGGGEDSPSIEEPVYSTTADFISVSYAYTSEMVTVIYHLYGSVLDDFLVMQITNEGTEDARVKVVSEIQEYTTEAVDTVLVGAGRRWRCARIRG